MSIPLHAALINEFYLTPIQISSLDTHYVLNWTGAYLKHVTTIHNTIIRQDIEYIVVLPECVKSKFYATDQVKVSFRKPKVEFGGFPYALVRFG